MAGRVANVCAGPFGAFYEVDLFLSFSGLHMIPEPERAVAEIARCLKPGDKVGNLIGTLSSPAGLGCCPQRQAITEKGRRHGRKGC